MLNRLQEAASSVTAGMNNAAGLFQDGKAWDFFVFFGKLRAVCVFRIHIKYCSWNTSVFYSKQFYMLVSRTERAILGHQVPSIKIKKNIF